MIEKLRRMKLLIGIVLGALAIGSAFGSATIWIADSRYVTFANLKSELDRRELKRLENLIFELELEPVPTAQQRALINHYKRQRADIKSHTGGGDGDE